MRAHIAGYQGAASVHSRALHARADTLGQAGCAARLRFGVTADGMSARQLLDAVGAGAGHPICYLASGYLSARAPALRALDLACACADTDGLFAALDGAARVRIAADIRAATRLQVLGSGTMGGGSFRPAFAQSARRPIARDSWSAPSTTRPTRRLWRRWPSGRW